MRVLIVENEKPASDRIIRLLKKIDPAISVLEVLESVEGTINWLPINESPDLILMDIQLDDGLCFEIFEAVNVEIPVIFITAYDEYTLKAFKVNCVDYLLKPVEEKLLSNAIMKYRRLFPGRPLGRPDFSKLLSEFRNTYKSRFLVKIGDKFRSVPTEGIRYFHIRERNVFIKDFGGKEYAIDHSLDQLQKILDPGKFYRINRDCIINIQSVSLIYSYSSSRLQLILGNEEKSEEFVVSRDRVAGFKKWIDA
jgi:DNA-binding LytR/AlgR family response regulator